jgi:hypothetical protein
MSAVLAPETHLRQNRFVRNQVSKNAFPEPDEKDRALFSKSSCEWKSSALKKCSG